jgi:hypothetical protein
MIYDTQHFITKFLATVDEQWCVGEFNHAGQSCALGHCGCGSPDGRTFVDKTEESEALDRLLKFQTVHINDGLDHRYTERTPRARILAALRDLP